MIKIQNKNLKKNKNLTPKENYFRTLENLRQAVACYSVACYCTTINLINL